SPALVMRSCGGLAPESCCFGRSPKQQPTSRLRANRCGSSIVNTNAIAVNVPTPETCVNNAVCGYRVCASCSSISSYSNPFAQLVDQLHKRCRCPPRLLGQ